MAKIMPAQQHILAMNSAPLDAWPKPAVNCQKAHFKWLNMMMTAKFKKSLKLTALCLPLFVGACGGNDPNEDVPAVAFATCKIKSHWPKIQLGMSIPTVVSILGQPNEIQATTTSRTYIYEACRIFVVKSEDSSSGSGTALLLVSGSVTFSGGTAGYVSAIASPKYPDDKTVYREYSDTEALAFSSVSK